MYWPLWVAVLWMLLDGLTSSAKFGGKYDKAVSWAAKAIVVITAVLGLAELFTL